MRSPTSVCFNLTVTSAPAERRNHRGQDRRNAELHQSNTGRELNDRAIKGLTRAVPAEYRVDGIGTCSLIGFCEAIRNGHDLVNDRQPLAPPPVRDRSIPADGLAFDDAKTVDKPAQRSCYGCRRNGHGHMHHHFGHTPIEAGVVVATGWMPSSPPGVTKVRTLPA